MGIALQLLFTGIGVGSIYALVALGFVLIYRATNVVNFAQGEFAMLGAFMMVTFGAVFNLAVYYPLRHRPYLPVVISTIGASILLSNSMLAFYGPAPQTL